jgi:uncharacterized protein (DUF1778 family)
MMQVQQLVDRLNATTEEMEALQHSFERTLAVKEHELRAAKDMLGDQQQVFQQAQSDLDHKLAALQQCINHNRCLHQSFILCLNTSPIRQLLVVLWSTRPLDSTPAVPTHRRLLIDHAYCIQLLILA